MSGFVGHARFCLRCTKGEAADRTAYPGGGAFMPAGRDGAGPR